MAAIADQHAVVGLDTVLLDRLELLEELWDVDDAAGADQIYTAVCEDAGCWADISFAMRLLDNGDSRRMCTSNVMPFFTIV